VAGIGAFRRFFPAAIFLTVAAASTVTAGYAYMAATEAARLKLEGAADDAISRIETRLELHLSLLRATVALFKSGDGSVSRDALRSFVLALDIDGRYAGIRGIGYARLIRTGAEAAAENDLIRNYGDQRPIWPGTSQLSRAVVTLLEPTNETNRATLGFDMMSEPVRRSAVDRAIETGEPQATSRVGLAREGGSDESGFLVYLPLILGVGGDAPRDARVAATAGLVYAAFRGEDLFSAALAKAPLLPLAIQVYDGDPVEANLLFSAQVAPDDRAGADLKARRDMQFAGRQWTLLFQPTAGFEWPTSRLISLAFGVLGLLLAVALAWVASSGEKAFAAVSALNAAGEKNLQEKDLLLQEMNHRIKNSIARVVAIARQTANGTTNLDDFVKSFSARMQAMAASQDLLTRSSRQGADLRELLAKEIEQVLGRNMNQDRLSGPDVEIDQASTQALGLTFHELATNALKYGALAGGNNDLSVRWNVTGREHDRNLVIFWREQGSGRLSEPVKRGFGSKLIEANIVRELGGSIERRYPDDGMIIEIAIPLNGPADKEKGRSHG